MKKATAIAIILNDSNNKKSEKTLSKISTAKLVELAKTCKMPEPKPAKELSERKQLIMAIANHPNTKRGRKKDNRSIKNLKLALAKLNAKSA